MKNLFLLFSCFLLTSFSFAQTIRRVTNLPVTNLGVNVYPTVADAITAAVDGDIIYIEPSDNAYASFTVNKRLDIVGNGSFLVQNPNTPYEKSGSSVEGTVNLAAGSSGSSVTGIQFLGQVAIFGADNVKFRRNFVQNYLRLGANTSGTLIAENFILGTVGGMFEYTTSAQSTLIRNNIIYGLVRWLRNSTLQNNTIYYAGSIVSDCYDSVISNNILDRRTVGSVYLLTSDNAGSIASNNLQIVSPSAILPTDNPDALQNKYTNASTGVFSIPNPWAENPLKDASFKLGAGSPAIGMGSGGTDAGAYGGTFPYTLSMLPNIPIITSAVSTTSGTNTVPISVTISVRSN